jgi:uncharacterized membrane protein YhaH (DUF805 family)
MDTEKFFYSNDGQDHGPYTLSELRYGKISSDITDETLIWKEGTSDRKKATEIEVLRGTQIEVSPEIDQTSLITDEPSKSDRAAEFSPPPIPNELSLSADQVESNQASGLTLELNPLAVYKKSFTIQGRVCRKEFWSFQMYYFSIIFVLSTLLTPVFMDPVTMAILLMGFIVVSIPAQVSLQIRRLHDLDLSAWWFFLGGLLFSPALVLAYLFKGSAGVNSFGAARFK